MRKTRIHSENTSHLLVHIQQAIHHLQQDPPEHAEEQGHIEELSPKKHWHSLITLFTK